MLDEPRLLGHRAAVLSALLIVLLSALFGALYNAASPRPLSLTTPLASQPGEISVEQVRLLLGRDDFVLLDARENTFYQRSHLPTALQLSPEEFQDELPSIRERLESRRIVVYCSGPRCTKAEELRALLEKKGYLRVELMRGGLAAWVKAGYPVVSR